MGPDVEQNDWGGIDPDTVFRLVGLPLLAGLENDETSESAAWALCTLARDCPDVIPTVVEQLLARSSPRRPPVVVRTLAHLESAFPDRVRPLLVGTDGDLKVRVVEGEGWPFDGDTDPDDASAAVERVAAHTGAESASHRDQSDLAAAPEVRAVRRSGVVDGLSVTDSAQGGRYATVVPARGTVEDRSRRLTLRFFDPDSESFARALREALRQWRAVDDVAGVVTVHDAGLEPRPWVVTDDPAATLANLTDPPVTAALGAARSLAETVTRLHQRGVVHGGIDPRCVLVPGDDTGPRVDCPGLLDVFDTHGRTGSFLDPRFAAPEHHDRTRGQIDHATDVYGLGAVLYRLTTGESPFEGATEEVYQAIESSSPVPPSDVRPDLPTALDDVVAKAMARDKLRRYETVRQLLAELRRLA